MKQLNPLAWEEGFPPVYGQTSISFLKHRSGFGKAKHGDMCAALIVANECINPPVIIEIKQKYPQSTLLPVVTNNKLPEAFAIIMGMATYAGVSELKTVSRKSLSAMERLLHKPTFQGAVTKGVSYIIVDDIITQGGTVSALRRHIIANGGTVAAIVSLSCSVDSKTLAPKREDIYKLTDKFGFAPITDALRKYGIAHDLEELTRAQVRYLLRFKRIETLIAKIEKTRQGKISA